MELGFDHVLTRGKAIEASGSSPGCHPSNWALVAFPARFFAPLRKERDQAVGGRLFSGGPLAIHFRLPLFVPMISPLFS